MAYSVITSASQFQILQSDMIHRKEAHCCTILRDLLAIMARFANDNSLMLHKRVKTNIYC